MAAMIRPAEPEDLQPVLALLRQADLPLEGVTDHFDDFLVAEDNGEVVGSSGLELFGQVGLLRSVAVRTDKRKRHLGTELTRAALEQARSSGVRQLYLFTVSARDFFARFGFRPVSRDALDPALSESAELQGGCPDTAVAMRLLLK